MAEYVEDFLEARASFIGGEPVVKAIVRRYREGLEQGNNATASVLGELMLEIAKPFGDLGDPEWRSDWKP
ncbi:hypothetical protein [Streptomyces sp. 769]|uniref:hypothetical protein n=1 Tax=Streptomyces sp. 769 TaxID=1262452 RepID=UPI00057DD595|nr:hypothetical protein [Streptomyces sp. 769]